MHSGREYIETVSNGTTVNIGFLVAVVVVIVAVVDGGGGGRGAAGIERVSR